MGYRFEEMIETMHQSDRLRHIMVADAMYLGMKWFEDYGIKYTARDLLRYAELVQRQGLPDNHS